MAISRRGFIVSLAAVVPTIFISRVAHAEHYDAMLCSSCGFGSKKDACAKCGKWRGSTSIPARLCGDHGFGSKKDNCCRCGKWIGSNRQRAYIGSCCGFGSAKDNCVVCGKWAP